MKLKETVSWLMGTLQQHLFPPRRQNAQRVHNDPKKEGVTLLADSLSILGGDDETRTRDLRRDRTMVTK
jgi:hypothetical protein